MKLYFACVGCETGVNTYGIFDDISKIDNEFINLKNKFYEKTEDCDDDFFNEDIKVKSIELNSVFEYNTCRYILLLANNDYVYDYDYYDENIKNETSQQNFVLVDLDKKLTNSVSLLYLHKNRFSCDECYTSIGTDIFKKLYPQFEISLLY